MPISRQPIRSSNAVDNLSAFAQLYRNGIPANKGGSGSRPSAASTKQGYATGDDDSMDYRRDLAVQDLAKAVDANSSKGNISDAGAGFQPVWNQYSSKYLDGRDMADFLINASADEMYQYVNDPIVADWYKGYGDLSDRDTFMKWFNDNETYNRVENMDASNDAFDSKRVLHMYGNDAGTIDYLNSALAAAGLQMTDRNGNMATAKNLGLNDLYTDQDQLNAAVLEANKSMLNQAVLGSLLLGEDLNGLDIDDINALADENIEYALNGDYNNARKPEGVRTTVSNVPDFDSLWYYDPDVYAMSMEQGWNANGLGSGYRGLANLLAQNGVSYNRRSEEE